jgi:hypothetical protein
MHSTNNNQTTSQVIQSQSSYKFFKIKVKLGHVSRRKYLPMNLPIKARSIHEAIEIARNHGGVKRDHQNWCLEKPVEISLQDFLAIKKETYNDPYWEGKTRNRLDLFEDRLIDEDDSYNCDQDYLKMKRVKEKKGSNIKQYLKRKNKVEERMWQHIEEADQAYWLETQES